jgi:hypothetical protein
MTGKHTQQESEHGGSPDCAVYFRGSPVKRFHPDIVAASY